MQRPLFLVISDLHIRNGGEWLFVSRPFIRNDLLVSMSQINQLILDARPRGLLICGDVFHSALIQSGDLNLLLGLINTCKKTKTQIFYVQGQHDRAEPKFLSTIDPNVTHLHQKKIDFHGVSMVGLDYVRNGLEEQLASLPSADIFVTHQCWKRHKKSLFGDILVSDLCRDYPLTISGDIHTHCLIDLETNNYVVPTDGSVYNFKRCFASPGPPCYQKIDDTGPFGVFMVEDTLTITAKHLKVRPIIRLLFHTDDQTRGYIQGKLKEDLSRASQLPAEISKPIFVVKTASVLSSLEDLKMAIGENGFVFVSPIKKTSLAPTNDNPACAITIEEMLEETLQNSAYAKEIIRLFKAGVIGPEALKQEIDNLYKEIEENAVKEVEFDEFLSTPEQHN